MAYNTKSIVTDIGSNPIAQYFNKELDKYEPLEGSGGGNKVVLFNKDGTENNELSLLPILDKLSQLTGTVIDENTRKSNELQRIALYDLILKMLEDGELQGEQGIQGIPGETGKGLEFNWQGTSLGFRVEGEIDYVYVDLKGESGDIEIVNNLIETVSGKALDATQGGILNDSKMPKSGGTFTGGVEFDSEVLYYNAFSGEYNYLSSSINNKLDAGRGTLISYAEKLVSLSGASVVINLLNGNTFTHSLTENVIYTVSNVITGQTVNSFTLIVNQAATLRTLTFPASVKWQHGEIPDLSTASKTYILTFITVDGGTNWLGMLGGEF